METFSKFKDEPLRERLKVIDKEIEKLFFKCEKAGYGADTIQNIALPVLHTARRGYWKVQAKRFVTCVILFAIYTFVVKWDTSSRAIGVVYKKCMVDYVLPYYDWTWLWNDECLLLNPYYNVSDGIGTEECSLCEDIKNITTFNDVNHEFMSDTLFRMEPTIIEDAMQDWPSIIQPISLHDIMQMYVNLPSLQGEDKIFNLRISKGLTFDGLTVKDLHETIQQEESANRQNNFTSYWCNIHKDSSREIHKLYHRPYFLPGMCEPVRESNCLLVARKSDIKSRALVFNPDRREEKGYWFAQLHGALDIVLRPTSVCREVCSNIRFLLKRGQILNIPDHRLYDMGYRPNSYESVAVAVGYMFN